MVTSEESTREDAGRRVRSCRRVWKGTVRRSTTPHARLRFVDDTAVIAAYGRLLASIGSRADDIGDRPVVTHWPHVGSAYRGLVIVGQAVAMEGR